MTDERVEKVSDRLEAFEAHLWGVHGIRDPLLAEARAALDSLERELEELRHQHAQEVVDRGHAGSCLRFNADTLTELSAAREVVEAGKGLRDWAGCTKHFPEGCPDGCEELAAIQRWDDALSHYDEVK